MSRFAQWVALALLCLCGCATSTGDPGTDTNTNWVKSCERDAQCGGETSCECRICTLACSEDADCKGLSQSAVCLPDPSGCSRFERICAAPDMSLGTPSDADAGVPDTPSDADAGVPVPASYNARPSFAVFDLDRYGRQVRVGDDDAIYVVGGQGRTPADLSVTFRNFWLAKFSPAGVLDWERIEPNDDDGSESHGLSLALSPDGVITTVATVYDGSDTPVIRQHDVSGTLLTEFSVEPGISRLATGSSGELLAAGSNLVEFSGGRPFTEIWVGALRNESVDWEVTRRGVEGSVSNAWDIVPTADGYFVVGAGGTEASSNAASTWLARGSYGVQDFDWEVVREDGVGQGLWRAATTPEGGVVIAGGPIVARYDAEGNPQWDRELVRYPTAIAASQGGYAIGYASRATTGTGDDTGRIDYFDWDGTLIWTLEDTACQGVVDIVAHEDDFVALFECGFSFGLFSIPMDQQGAGLGSVGVGTPALRACSRDAQCEADHVCESGTCARACTATEQCPADYRCVQQFSDQGDCPYLGPGEVGTAGVCLPRCYQHEQCANTVGGLSCWGNSCVVEVPECELRCRRLIDGCAEGCSEIRGRGVAPDQACFATEERLLGCYPEGRGSTTEDGCVKSADGVVYSAGGLYAGTLIREFGFGECTEEDQELLSSPTCEQ